MKQYPLSVYVLAVVIALAIVNLIVWYMSDGMNSASVAIHSVSFLLGMFAMYIAMYFYKHE